jgi:hypothetical protein
MAQSGAQAGVTGPVPHVYCSHCAEGAPPSFTRQKVPAGHSNENLAHCTAQDVPSSTVHALLLQVASVRLPLGQAS